MKVQRIPVGYLKANCYLITKDEKTIIIDPGDETERILSLCHDKNIVGILVTHHHFDHVGALLELENHFNIKHNASIKDFNYKVIKNPGHSEDSISFYFSEENILFSGDFVFKGTIGRCDLEDGNFKEMQESIKMILSYPEDMTIYPGHGWETTLKDEINNLSQYI